MTNLVSNIKDQIIKDINSRRGFGEAWRMLGSVRKKEITEKWSFIITSNVEEFLAGKVTESNTDELEAKLKEAESKASALDVELQKAKLKIKELEEPPKKGK